MDRVEEGDHLALSGLAERGGLLLINDVCRQSPKAEIKYFCLNVTFVSFAGVEKGICQNPQALAKAGFPLGARWELLPPLALMAFLFYPLDLILTSRLHAGISIWNLSHI